MCIFWLHSRRAAEGVKCRRVLITQICSCWGWAKLKETAMLVTVCVSVLIISPISYLIHYFRHLKKQRFFSAVLLLFLLHALLVEYIFRWKAINHVSGFHFEHAMQSQSVNPQPIRHLLSLWSCLLLLETNQRPPEIYQRRQKMALTTQHCWYVLFTCALFCLPVAEEMFLPCFKMDWKHICSDQKPN